jgi:transcriptional regulator with XRE-family HTH domain
MKNRTQVSTFGHIYHEALQSQLKKIGSALSLLRYTRHEEIDRVAAAINLRPGTLQQIEDGKQDLRIKTLIALCEYYKVDIESMVGKGELLRFKIA